MQEKELIPHLFKTEYSKLTAVLCKLFGVEHIETAQDLVSDTFVLATETWEQKGLPENPTAWLYTVAKNKAKDFLKHKDIFVKKVAPELKYMQSMVKEPEVVDLSTKNISDSQLQMIFTLCHPCNPPETQVALALNILCGFGAEEIADAFLSNKETIYKRLTRGKEKLRLENVKIEVPAESEISARLDAVLTTLYLLFSEGYHSSSQKITLRKDLCLEAIRLNLLLTANESTNTTAANALLSLMCFHSSRFDARTTADGELVLYEDQDTSRWNQELIEKGIDYLNRASSGKILSKYHIEAAIAYWHTHKEDTAEKWENILQLYNRLLILEYSPMAALNRTYALSKARGKKQAIDEAEKLKLVDNHLYHLLLSNLYTHFDNQRALKHLETALGLVKTDSEKKLVLQNMKKIQAL